MTSSLKSALFSTKYCAVSISAIVLMICVALFMTIGVTDWQFALELRLKKVATLMVVGFAIGTSTLLFQTLTHNPILTPSLLGFDALYVLIKSVMVFWLGAVGMVGLPALMVFGFEVVVMMVMSMAMFLLLFTRHQHDLTRLILVGVIFGVLFRSLSALIARLINPDDFVVIQSASFANFNTINASLLGVSAIICALCVVVIWRYRFACDVLLLGRYPAINLGVNYHRLVLILLAMIALLVSVSTALVGPVTFFGLLVCALANQVASSMHHGLRLILTTLIACVCLVGGQMIFEHVLGMAGVLSVVIELVGGIVFLWLMFRQYKPLTANA